MSLERNECVSSVEFKVSVKRLMDCAIEPQLTNQLGWKTENASQWWEERFSFPYLVQCLVVACDVMGCSIATNLLALSGDKWSAERLLFFDFQTASPSSYFQDRLGHLGSQSPFTPIHGKLSLSIPLPDSIGNLTKII